MLQNKQPYLKLPLQLGFPGSGQVNKSFYNFKTVKPLIFCKNWQAYLNKCYDTGVKNYYTFLVVPSMINEI